MSGNVNAVVLGAHRVHHEFDGKETVSTKADGVVKMTKAAFDDAEKFGAVRRATKDDREAVVVAEDAPTVETLLDDPTPGRKPVARP